MMVEEKNARLSYSSVTLVALMLFSSWTSVLASAEAPMTVLKVKFHGLNPGVLIQVGWNSIL